MKQILIALLIILSINSFGQTEKKPEIKVPADTNYVLAGKITGFQLLYKAVINPEKMTREEINSIVQWLQTIQALPVKKEEDKKKN